MIIFIFTTRTIIQYLSFCVWTVSLKKKMPSSFVHVVTNGWVSSSYVRNNLWCICIFSIPTHLITNVCMSWLLWIGLKSEWIWNILLRSIFPFLSIPRSRMAGSHNSVWYCEDTPHYFAKWLCQWTIQSAIFSTPLSTSVIFCFSDNAIWTGLRWYSILLSIFLFSFFQWVEMLSSFPHVLDVCASFSFLFEDLGQFYQSLKETSKGSQAVNHSSCLEEGNGEEKERKKLYCLS